AAAGLLPPDAEPAPPPAGGVPLRARGPEGGRRGQRRHALLHPPARRPRRAGPALPAGQGGATVGPRALPRPERLSARRAARRRRPAPDAGGDRRLPRLAEHRRSRRRAAALLRAPVP